MYKTHNNGALSLANVSQKVKLCGWVHKIRNKGFLTWIDLRDRYGITQLVADQNRTDAKVLENIKNLGREFVIQISGTVIERENKNPHLPTGAIEILLENITILNASLTPPFTIENQTDGGEVLRMQYRYLDIRRNPIQKNLIFRHKITLAIRNFLAKKNFLEIETPYLIKSTPEGARDFVVPSRMHVGQFYALPQSPQTFKQLLMVGGMDKYFQIVRCFRDEDLRSDRQPEFTQLDCEMAFVNQEAILQTFEEMLCFLLEKFCEVSVKDFPRITYEEAIRYYGNDKPDIRFGMRFGELNEVAKNKDFKIFNEAELVVGIAIPGAANYTRKQIDALVDWIKRPQVGASGMVYVKYNEDGSFKSSVDRFYEKENFKKWAEKTQAKKGDLICILSGDTEKVRGQLSAFRMEMAERLGLRKPKEFAALWVVDFPLLEWDSESKHYHPKHHPFTAPKPEHIDLLQKSPEKVCANAYDLVLNGNEIGGGSVRIYKKDLQEKMFELLGFSKEQAQEQFGFLMNAFKYGAPPHAGIAFGLDRLVAILAGSETIRDFIAFPKNNAGRDVMIDAPSFLEKEQMQELGI